MMASPKEEGIARPKTIEVTEPDQEKRTHLSPMSPSSHFTRNIIANVSNSIFPFITLCHWDNIMGPKVRHLWLTRTSSRQLTKDVLQSVASHTLNSEICRDPHEPPIDTRLNVAPERNLAFYSSLFGAKGIHEQCVHSLCFVMSKKNLQHFLCMQDVCRQWILRMSSNLRTLLAKTDFDEATATFSRYLAEFIKMIESLRQNKLPFTIHLVDTAFHPQHKFDPAFLQMALAAHLISLGRTVIIGNSKGKINLLISALAMFLSSDEQRCCRYVDEDKPLPYHQDLCLQGILQKPDDDLPPSLAEIVFSQYPTSVIDLNKKRILQSAFFPEHYIKRQEALKHEVASIANIGNENHTATAKFSVWEVLEPFADSSSTHIVEEFMQQFLYLPPSPGTKEGLVLLFKNQLYKRVLALIRYVEDLVAAGKVPLSLHLKRLRQDLDLTGSGDFNLVLGAAEKVRPGFCQSVLSE